MSCKYIKIFSDTGNENLRSYLGYWITTLTLTIATPALAQQAINIPAKPLSEALQELGEKTDLQIIYDANLISGKTSKSVQGTLKANEALHQLLSGTGITYTLSGNSVTLITAANSSQKSTTILPPIKVSGAAALSAATEGTGSYTTNQSSYGKGQSLKELPQSVTVMTRQRIDDQQLKTLDDLMIHTPGITVQQENSVSSSFYSRGFKITSFQIDGNSPMYGEGGLTYGLNTSQLDLATFDSIEILRGSDALYGTSGEPGGVINLVRKKPTKQFQVKALAHAGSWNNYRGELDVGGSIMADGRIRGRLVGVYEDRKYFYDFGKSDKQLVYGIVEADVTDSTLLTFGADYTHQDFGSFNQFGLPRYSNGEDIGLRRSYYLGGPDDRWLRKNNKQFVRIDQAIGTNWTLGIEASRAQSKNYRRDMSWYEAINPMTLTGSSTFRDREFDYDETQKTLDAVLKGSFHMLGHEHRVILGTNINRRDLQNVSGIRNSNITLSPNIFEFNPLDHILNEPYISITEAKTKVVEKGVYGSVVAQIVDPLKLILGGRLSWYEYDNSSVSSNIYTPGGATTYSKTQYEDNKIFTPYLGLVFDLTEQWSTYASIAETYKSQASNRKGPLPGTPLKPITGRSYEIGIKRAICSINV